MKLPIEPVAKPRMTQSDKWRQRPVVAKYWKFKDELRLALPEYKTVGVVRVVFGVRMPKSWNKGKKRDFNGKPHQRRPDLDNFIKAFNDALYDEDGMIYEIQARKVWDYDGFIEIY